MKDFESKNICYVCGYDSEDLVKQLAEMQNEKDELISKYRYWKGEYVDFKNRWQKLKEWASYLCYFELVDKMEELEKEGKHD